MSSGEKGPCFPRPPGMTPSVRPTRLVLTDPGGQATGRPVVTSTVCSMPEVADDAACLVDPLDVASIREGILKIINDPAPR